MLLEGRAGAEGTRGSQQHAVEVDVVVTDPMLHRWQEAQELQADRKVLSRQKLPTHFQANRCVCLVCHGTVSGYSIPSTCTDLNCKALQESGLPL